MDGRRFTVLWTRRPDLVEAYDSLSTYDLLQKYAINERRELEIQLNDLKKPGAYLIYGTDIIIRTE